MKKGFSLIETLVVVALFSVIGIVVSQSTAISLTGSRKADASTLVRENLNNAASVMERHLRSARSVTCSTTPPETSISYKDENGNDSTFSCNVSPNCNSGTNTYVSSGSASVRLTSSQEVCITACEFRCNPSTGALPPNIQIYLQGRSKNISGVEDTTIDIRTSVTVRAY